MTQKIDWIEFKEWKDPQSKYKKSLGNLYLLISFLAKEKHLTAVSEIYSLIKQDEMGEVLLNKNEIQKPDDIIDFMKNKK